MRTLETVEAGKATTSARDTRQADIEETRDMVESRKMRGRRSCRNC
jgi:hypothetical protein